jgi:hypothetical protein
MVNSDVMDKIRSGQAEWLRGDIKGFTEEGVRFNLRGKGVPKGVPGKSTIIKGDIVVMVTGFERPTLDFLPDDSFDEPYSPPNWYLQTFPPQHVSVCCNNCTVSASHLPSSRSISRLLMELLLVIRQEYFAERPHSTSTQLAR